MTTLSSIFINILLSIVFVVLLHFAWNYIVEHYGNPNTKNLLEFQTKKYLTIIDELSHKPNNESLTIIPLDIEQNLEQFVTELSK